MPKNCNFIEKLREIGLRPTKQRVKMCEVLFNREKTFHFTINDLVKMISDEMNEKISLATVYNTLRQFVDAGLLREVLAGPGRSYFDTDISHHHHFYHVDENRLEDLPIGVVSVESLPQPPAGSEIERVDVVIRLRRH